MATADPTTAENGVMNDDEIASSIASRIAFNPAPGTARVASQRKVREVRHSAREVQPRKIYYLAQESRGGRHPQCKGDEPIAVAAHRGATTTTLAIPMLGSSQMFTSKREDAVDGAVNQSRPEPFKANKANHSTSPP